MIRIIKKFGLLLNRKQKSRVVVIVLLMLVSAILETASVSLIVPLMTALMNVEFINENKYAGWICEILDIHDARTFILLVVVALIFLFIIKNVFLFFQNYVQIRFICNNRVATQRRLIETYLNRPYEFFLNSSSGEILRVVRNDTSGTFTLLTIVMNFFTEFIVAISLIVAIIVVDPQMAILLAVLLSIVMLIVYKGVKPILKKAGLKQQESAALSNKWLLQAIAGIKELKVANKEKFFVEQYSEHAKQGVESEKISSVLSSAPRLIIESITIAGMLGYIGVMIYSGKEMSQLLPQISAFAVAAVRLLPSANRMSVALNSIAYQEPQLDQTIKNIHLAEQFEREDSERKMQHSVKKTDISFKSRCGLRDIEYSYPGTDNPVLQGASMEIPAGKFVGIIGTSGAGKTTAVDILLGLLDNQKGLVYSDENNIKDDYKGWLKHLAYIPQMIYMLDDTVLANVAFGYEQDMIDERQAWHALDEAQLGEFVRSLPNGIYTEIGERGVRLSGGQRQRLGIARALYTDPELLIFDEATSALDNETEAAIMDSINGLHGKKTIIIIAHRLTTIKECDIVYRVENGVIEQINEVSR